MTVSSQTNNATFVGNGVTTVFPLPFRFFSNGDVFAYFIDQTTGASTPMVLGTDYTLAGAAEPEVNGNAVSVFTTTAPLANGRGLYVERIMQEVQSTDIVNQGEFFASTHEDVFDRLTMLIQQANGNSQGAIRVAIGDPEPTRLAPAAQRANRILSFDENGSPVAIDAASDSSLVLRQELANSTDPARGVSLIGRAWQAADSVALLRTLPTTGPAKYALTAGYYSRGDGGYGMYYVPADFTGLVNNDSTVIEADDGGFWLLNHAGLVQARQGGVRGDRVTDDTLSLTALANALSVTTQGAAIVLSPRDRIYIAGTGFLPVNTRIIGSSGAGTPGNGASAAQVVFSGSSLIFSAGAQLSLGGSTMISNVVFAYVGITGNMPDASAFAGTPLVAAGDDIRFSYCSFMGFSRGYSSDGYQRASFDHCYFDCRNGIRILNCFDIPKVTDCHFWPWLTVATGNVGIGTANSNYRPGAAIHFDNVSWPVVTTCFTYGYAVGVWADNCTNPTIRLQAEGIRDAGGTLIETVGCHLDGSTYNAEVTLQTARTNLGVYQTVTSGLHNKINSGMFRDMGNCGIAIVTGDATIDNNSTRGVGGLGIGVRVLGGAGLVSIPTHTTTDESQGIQINNTTTSVGEVLARSTATPVLTSQQQFQIVAATALPITALSKHWYVTGGTTINNFLETFNGHRVTVIFTGALTLNDGSGAGALRVGGTLAVSAGSTLDFVCNGLTGAMTWRRVS